MVKKNEYKYMYTVNAYMQKLAGFNCCKFYGTIKNGLWLIYVKICFYV